MKQVGPGLDLKLVAGNASAVMAAIFEMIKRPGSEWRITVKPWNKRRSLDANAQQWVWYKAISDHTGEDIETVSRRCKMMFGLPILMEDPEAGPPISYMLQKCGFWNMSEAQQFKVVAVLNVTSIMSSKQHSQYRDQMLAYWNDQGVAINYLEPEFNGQS